MTLLLCNSLENELCPFRRQTSADVGRRALFGSVCIGFGEILPSAIFGPPTGMAALCAPLVKCVLGISPITYPIRLLLDHYLPEEDDCEEPDGVARVEVEGTGAVGGRPAPSRPMSRIWCGASWLYGERRWLMSRSLKRVATVSASAAHSGDAEAHRDAGHSRIPRGGRRRPATGAISFW